MNDLSDVSVSLSQRITILCAGLSAAHNDHKDCVCGSYVKWDQAKVPAGVESVLAGEGKHATNIDSIPDEMWQSVWKPLQMRYGGGQKAMSCPVLCRGWDILRFLRRACGVCGPAFTPCALSASPGRDRFFMGHTDFRGLAGFSVDAAAPEEILCVATLQQGGESGAKSEAEWGQGVRCMVCQESFESSANADWLLCDNMAAQFKAAGFHIKCCVRVAEDIGKMALEKAQRFERTSWVSYLCALVTFSLSPHWTEGGQLDSMVNRLFSQERQSRKPVVIRVYVGTLGTGRTLTSAGGCSSSAALTGSFSAVFFRLVVAMAERDGKIGGDEADGEGLTPPRFVDQHARALIQLDSAEYLLGLHQGTGDKSAIVCARAGCVTVLSSRPPRPRVIAECKIPRCLRVCFGICPIPRLSSPGAPGWLVTGWPSVLQAPSDSKLRLRLAQRVCRSAGCERCYACTVARWARRTMTQFSSKATRAMATLLAQRLLTRMVQCGMSTVNSAGKGESLAEPPFHCSCDIYGQVCQCDCRAVSVCLSFDECAVLLCAMYGVIPPAEMCQRISQPPSMPDGFRAVSEYFLPSNWSLVTVLGALQEKICPNSTREESKLQKHVSKGIDGVRSDPTVVVAQDDIVSAAVGVVASEFEGVCEALYRREMTVSQTSNAGEEEFPSQFSSKRLDTKAWKAGDVVLFICRQLGQDGAEKADQADVNDSKGSESNLSDTKCTGDSVRKSTGSEQKGADTVLSLFQQLRAVCLDPMMSQWVGGSILERSVPCMRGFANRLRRYDLIFRVLALCPSLHCKHPVDVQHALLLRSSAWYGLSECERGVWYVSVLRALNVTPDRKVQELLSSFLLRLVSLSHDGDRAVVDCRRISPQSPLWSEQDGDSSSEHPLNSPLDNSSNLSDDSSTPKSPSLPNADPSPGADSASKQSTQPVGEWQTVRDLLTGEFQLSEFARGAAEFQVMFDWRAVCTLALRCRAGGLDMRSPAELWALPGSFQRSLPAIDEVCNQLHTIFGGRAAGRISAAGMGGALCVHVDTSVLPDVARFFHQRGWQFREVASNHPLTLL